MPINWGNTGWLWEDNEERKWFDQIIAKTTAYNAKNPSYDISVQVTIPNEWQQMAPVNVGVTAGIETTKVAHQWIEKSLLMDRIVTPSQFAADIFQNTKYVVTNNATGETNKNFKTTTPFKVVHYPYKHEIKSESINIDLEYDFNFLKYHKMLVDP